MDEKWDQITNLFQTASEFRKEERQAFLDADCSPTDIRATVLGLLEADERLAESVLLHPTVDEVILGVDDDEYIGLQLKDRYVIERFIGSGGMSSVYLARDLVLTGKRWAVKILKGSSIHNERVIQEDIKALTMLDGHPAIVAVTDAGAIDDGLPYFVMPYVEGTTLRERVGSEPTLSFEEVSLIVSQVASALTTAHAKGILHLDVKPGNIVLQSVNGAWQARLIDFGAAKIQSLDGQASGVTSRYFATIGYVAPEQMLERPHSQSDVYSLGVVAFEMLTGRRPSNTDHEEFARIRANERSVRMENALPRATQRVIAKALAYEPSQRYSTPTSFSKALTASLFQTFGSFVRDVVRMMPSWLPPVLVSIVAAFVFAGLFNLWGPAGRPRAAGTTTATLANLTPDRVDELRELYTYGKEVLRRNITLQGLLAVFAVFVIRAGGHIRIPAFALKISTTPLCFILAGLLLYFWLEFGFVLDDLIKWRAEAWTLIAATGHTARASGFNDGGYVDGWFMAFRPAEHAINTRFAAGAIFFFCLFYCPIIAAAHACSVVLPWIAARQVIDDSNEMPWHHRCMLYVMTVVALVVLIASHLQFRYGGPNPNWMQPVVLVLTVACVYLLIRLRYQRVTGSKTSGAGQVGARQQPVEVGS
jgi:hypothetical protein